MWYGSSPLRVINRLTIIHQASKTKAKGKKGRPRRRQGKEKGRGTSWKARQGKLEQGETQDLKYFPSGGWMEEQQPGHAHQ